MSMPEPEAAKTLTQQARDGLVKYQGWLYPVLIGFLYLIGRVSAEQAYRAYGLSTQDVGFGTEDGITALVFLLVIVGLAVLLGQLLVGALAAVWHGLTATPPTAQPDATQERAGHRDWGAAGGSAVFLAACIAFWVYAATHLEQQTAMSCSVAVFLSIVFRLVTGWNRPATGDATALLRLRIGIALSVCTSLVALLLQTSWTGLPHEKTTGSSGAWPTFLVLAPHPRAFTMHSREAPAGLADGACVYSFGSHEGFTAVWGPVGASGSGRLVSGIDQLEAGCR